MSKNLNLYQERQLIGFWAHGTLSKWKIVSIIEKDEEWKYVITEDNGWYSEDYIVKEEHIMTEEKAIKYYKQEIKQHKSYIEWLEKKLSKFLTTA